MNAFLNEFGFCNLKSFLESLLAPQYKYLLISFSGLSATGEFLFGITGITLILLTILIFLELITGIWASKVRNRRISSRRLQRFALKFIIYFFFIIVFHRLKEDPALEDTAWLYRYMHIFFIMYFVGIHVKSIAENYTKITGRRSEFATFIKKINEKFFPTTKPTSKT